MSIHNRVPWRTLILAAVALAAAAFPGSLELLELNRAAAASGQVWRLATGHLVHGSLYHLGLDTAAWLLAGLLFEPALGNRYWGVLAGSAICIDTGFLFLQPDLAAYCGLSGVLNGIMVAGSLSLWRSKDRRGRVGRSPAVQYDQPAWSHTGPPGPRPRSPGSGIDPGPDSTSGSG